MMGKQHAVMGAAGWLILAAPSPVGLGVIEASAVTLMAGTIMARGAATLPDMDHTSASPTQALPPFARWGISRLIGKLSGGHRNGTHAVIGIVIFTLLAWLLSTVTISTSSSPIALPIDTFNVGAFLVAAFLSVLALQVSGIKGMQNYALAAVLALLIAVGAPDNIWWLPVVVASGAFIHSLGDFMTTAGINWIWPFLRKPKGGKDKWYGPIVHYKNGRWAMPFFGTTGDGASPKHKRRMWWFMFILNAYTALIMVVAIISIIGSFTVDGGVAWLTEPIGESMGKSFNAVFDFVASTVSGALSGA